MREILLVCSAGMSTSLLVTKMEIAAKQAGEQVRIRALPLNEARDVIEEVDIILLGPQVRFQKGIIDDLAAARKNGPIPVAVIDMRQYGTMDGAGVYKYVKQILGD